jgi:SAM-dependent methyltransferase
MRTEKLSRLSDYKKINSSELNYLVYTYLIRDIEYAVSTYARGRLLDIGCGNKPYRKAFENRITEYVGCDIVQSDQMLVDVICEAGNIPLPNESFDTVFSTQTIEHVEDYTGLINEAYRLLKPGGYFILSGPMYWPLHEEPHDYFRFTKYGFAYLFNKAGFETEKILPNGGIWATAGLALVHAFTNGKNRNLFFRIWRFAFLKMRLYRIHNIFFKWLDKVDYNPANTINYVVIGRKKTGHGEN